jgi:lysozyme family protein
VSWVISAEGGGKLVSDTGGATRWGISSDAHPDVHVESLTREQAETIYYERYWQPLHANALPPAIALVAFDAAVNVGVVRAVKLLQTILRVTVDGVCGPETVAAAKVAHRVETLAAVIELRLRYYDGLGRMETYAPYVYGWRMRCMRLAVEAGKWLA